MTARIEKTPFVYFLFLSALLIEGVLALGIFLSLQSMQKNAILFGYSLSRLLLAGLFASFLVVIYRLLIKYTHKQELPTSSLEWVDRQLITLDHLLKVSIGLLLVSLLGIAAILAARTPLVFDASRQLQKISINAPVIYQLAQAIIRQVEPLAVWFILACLQTLVLLFWAYSASYEGKLRDGSLTRVILLLLILAGTLWHGIILYFQLEVLLKIPGWKWYFLVKDYHQGHWLFLAISILALAGIQLAWKLRRLVWLSTGILIILGYMMQVGFGFIEGEGYESLRVIYSNSVFNNYAEAASRQPDFLGSLIKYEEGYADDWYLGTKPPGVLLIYNMVQRASEFFDPPNGYAGRFFQLTSVIAYTFPLLSMMVLIPLYFFTRKLIQPEEDAILPGILLIFCPTMILIPLFLDQALYPLLFITVLVLLQKGILSQSYKWTMLAGLASYLALYFGFSMIVLLPLSALWIICNHLFFHKGEKWDKTISMLVGWGAGLLAGYLLLLFFLNYDIYIRFTNAMQQHRVAKNYDPGIGQILNSLVLNNAEFITWNGIPLILLAVFALFRSTRRLVINQSIPLDGLTVPLLVTYIILNLTGQTDGEVQRLWLFMLPVWCIYTAEIARTLTSRKMTGISLIVTLELITTFLLFKFQNFYG